MFEITGGIFWEGNGNDEVVVCTIKNWEGQASSLKKFLSHTQIFFYINCSSRNTSNSTDKLFFLIGFFADVSSAH